MSDSEPEVTGEEESGGHRPCTSLVDYSFGTESEEEEAMEEEEPMGEEGEAKEYKEEAKEEVNGEDEKDTKKRVEEEEFVFLGSR